MRILLISLLLAAAPLAAQPSGADLPPLRSGTPVRVFLHGTPPPRVAGVLVSGTRDTLRLASPGLGLVLLSAADVQRLEASASVGPPWKYPLTDPRLGLPEVRQNPARPGVQVRISAESQPRTTQWMHRFTADSLYLFAEGRSTAVARADVRSLQVSTAPDRARGALWGGSAGAVAGALVALNANAGDDNDGYYPRGPFDAVLGGAVGWLVGGAVGWVLAPRRWQHVPVHAQER